MIQKTVDGLRQEGKPFIGALYAGLMNTWNGPKVLEFNCRFGDPETQSLLPLIDSDLFDICMACATSNLHRCPVKFKENTYACGVVVASGDYPVSSINGQPILGLDKVENEGLIVFHGGTKLT